MNNIKTFEQYINEKYDQSPLEGTCGVSIGKKKYIFYIKTLIKFCEDNYDISNVKIDDLIKLSCFKDVDVENNKPDKNSSIIINNKWVKAKDVTDEEWKQFKKEQYDQLMKSNLKYPIIITVDNNDKIKAILDGNHRVKKAKILKKDIIKAYKIPENDIKNLTDKELKKLMIKEF